MTSTQPAPVPARKSFAQVAAAANLPVIKKENRTSSNEEKGAQPIAEQTGSMSQKEAQTTVVIQDGPLEPTSNGNNEKPNEQINQVEGMLKATTLEDGIQGPPNLDSSKRANSDTKSVASRTTFALDEKESLRPDDSASMQAAVEEDAFSPSGSAIADSSDHEARAFRDQLHEIDRTGTLRRQGQPNPTAENPTKLEQRNGRIVYATPPAPSPFNPPVAATLIDPSRGGPPDNLVIPPDEKLLEALASPKDRLFVLKIEQDMIDFVRDSKEEFLQLPQTNSFYRMLSHKLADYYLLGHIIDESMTSVRIFRTPYARLPPPLIGPDPAAEGITPPPNVPARKIMRRGLEEEDVKDSSNAADGLTESKSASKATSEVDRGSGSDEGKDTPNKIKDKSAMTREERENWYNEARARIFKDFKEEPGDIPDGVAGQSEKGLSRSSSVSGIKKAKKTNRKQPKDDSFEARSAFSQFGPQAYTQNVPPQPGINGMYFDPMTNATVQGSYPAINQGFIQNQPSPMPGYSPLPAQDSSQFYHWSGQQAFQQGSMMPQNGFATQHLNQEYYNGMNDMNGGMQSFPSPNMAAQSTPKQIPPTLSNFNQGYQPQSNHGPWMQPYYQAPSAPYGMSNSFQQYPAGNNTQTMPHFDPAMYQYQSQGYNTYPMPQAQTMQYHQQQYAFNNANRPQFNPRTQAFVPAVQGMRMPQQNPQWMQIPQPFPNNHGARYAGGPQALQRQSSSTSQLSGFSSPHLSQSTPNRNRPNGQVNVQNHAQKNSQPGQSSISKWGAPPNLPAKPPPPATSLSFQVPRNSESQQPLPPHPFSTANDAQQQQQQQQGTSGNGQSS